MKPTLVLLCAALALAACPPTFKDIRKKHSDALEARLTQVTRIGKLLDLTPPLHRDDDRIEIPAAPQYSGAWPGGLAAHVALMYQEAFADLAAHGPTAARLPYANALNVCASLLRKGECPAGCTYSDCSCSLSRVEEQFARCEGLQILLVVRTLEYGAPNALTRTTPDLRVPDRGPEARAPDASARVDGAGRADAAPARLDGGVRDRPRPDTRPGPDLRLESWTFRGGLMRAEVHVYELATGRRLGGFRVRAESQPRIHRTTFLNEAVTPEAARGHVAGEFAESCQRALRDEIKRRVPAAYRF